MVGTPIMLEARIWCLRRSRQANLDWLEDWSRNAEVISFDRTIERRAVSTYQL